MVKITCIPLKKHNGLDSPRDRILPLHSTFLNLCHRPLARLSGLNFNRSRPPQTKMDKEFLEDGNLPRSENHLYVSPAGVC